MSEMAAALIAAAQLESKIRDFLDARSSGERDLEVRGNGVVLQAFYGNGLTTPRKTSWAFWGFAGGTVLNAFLVLKSLGVNTHRGFWMPPSHKQCNWYIYESAQA